MKHPTVDQGTPTAGSRIKDEGVIWSLIPKSLFSILEIFELSKTQKVLAKLVSHARLQGGWVGRRAV